MFCECLARIYHWLSQFLNHPNRIEMIKIAGGALAFGIGVWQYRKTQRWKRVEFLAAEMKTFYDDTAVREALTMLDWRRKKMALFKYREEDDTQKVTVYYALVARSLGVATETQYRKEESAIREIFERFLEYLARFEGFVATRVVKEEDFNPYLDYWVRLLAGHDHHAKEVTQEVLPALWKFIDYFHYSDVRKFVGRYHEVRFAEFKG
jgi:hypothetical protein